MIMIIRAMKRLLYRAEHLAALKRKNKIWTAALVLLGLAAMGLCVFFCLRTNTRNAPRMELYTTAVFTLAGWIGITVLNAVLRYNRALYTHEARILAAAGEERLVRGRVTLERKTTHITGSIDVRRVRIETANGTERAYLNAPFAAALGRALAEAADENEELTLLLIQGYVAGVET